MGFLGFGKKRLRKDDLLRWQNLIFDTPRPYLHATEKQLRDASEPIFMRHMEIANDSARLFGSTVNPNTFFSRYDLFVKECTFLVALSEFLQPAYSDIPQQLQRAIDRYDDIVIEFIGRAWADTIVKAERLKTDKGRQNRYSKFFEELSAYDYRMPERCKAFYRSLSPSKAVPTIDAQPPHPKRSETDYDEWLDFISKGGTTEEWERRKAKKKR